MKIKKPLFLTFLIFLTISCTPKIDREIEAILNSKDKEPLKKLAQLDSLYENEKQSEKKIKVLDAIERHIKEHVRDPQLLKHALEKKVFFSQSADFKNSNLLKLAQLSVQNLRDNTLAQDYLHKINEKELNPNERDQYFQLKVVSFINANEMDQAFVEIQDLLERKDLTPTERFKIRILKTRVLSNSNEDKFEEVEKIFLDLLAKNPNLSKKWKVRSQLALLYEENEEFKKALNQLKVMQKEDPDDELLELRIDQLAQRSRQQPGGRGRLRR